MRIASNLNRVGSAMRTMLTTDQDGRARFQGVSPGAYHAVLTAKGVGKVHFEVDLGPDESEARVTLR